MKPSLCAESAAHFKRHSSGNSRTSHTWSQVLELPPLVLAGLYNDLQSDSACFGAASETHYNRVHSQYYSDSTGCQ